MKGKWKMTLRMIRILWLKRSLKEKQSIVKRYQQIKQNQNKDKLNNLLKM